MSDDRGSNTRKLKMRHFLHTIFVVSTLSVAVSSVAAAQQEYLLGTASPGGTFHPVGVAISTLVNVELQESAAIKLTAVTTAGSAENVELLRNGEIQLAILQGLVASEAASEAATVPEAPLRSLTALWPNVEQFVIRAELSSTGTIDDLLSLENERVVLGGEGSGTLASSLVLLGNLGIDPIQHFDLVHLGYGPAADAMERGDVVAVALPAGLPTKSLARLRAAMGENAAILSFTEDQAHRADGGRNLWQVHVIAAGTYPEQARDIVTIAQPNFLAVRAEVSEEHAYLITRAIFENLDLLESLHDATQHIALDQALAGLPFALHPGAARYFAERGLDIPDDLLAD